MNVGEDFRARPNNSTLIIIPGAAFDKEKHRIGYGAGFYDKYLSKSNVGDRIALAFDFQVLDRIPFNEYDIKPDIIITEKEIIY